MYDLIFFVSLLKRTFWLLAGVLIGFLVDDPALPFILKSQKKVSKQNLDVLIIGAGISGIAIAKVVPGSITEFIYIIKTS